ncbi:MAG: hypothetical protein J4F37_12255 [Acidobacteria bacterium]|nr:hypothetical protein [Acidobacteriota bacterium]
MRDRWAVAAVMAVALLAVAAVPAPVAAQGDAPRTPWGAPDLQGVWDFRTITPLQRPEDLGDQAFLTEEEAARLEQEAVERDVRLWEADARRTEAGGRVGAYNNFWMDRGTNVVGNRRTSLIVDPPNGRMPPLTDEGQRRADERRAYRAEHPADSWLDRSSYDRCILGFNQGPPMTPGGYNQNMQLFQTPDHVVVLNEMVHDSRIIPLDGRPRTGIDSWTGESRGRWEGDTLVVETVDFTAKHNWRGTTPDRHLIEKFTRVDADTLLYEFTLTDPGTWTASWTAQVPMRRNDLPLFEYACHEGNYSLEGILSGTRADERNKAGQVSP